jgi:hypothetical protein
MNILVTIFAVLAVLCVPMVTCAYTTPIEFPPTPGPYSGDYVYITEPGKYTLEQNISHHYPVGIIISASSVTLDGQGYTMQPAVTDATSVGIWISLMDSLGKPVTEVTIKNVSIRGEGYGIYSEGIDSSDFSWGQNRDTDPDAVHASQATRNLNLSGLSIISCHEGITLSNQVDAKIVTSTITDNTGSGITVRGGRVQIQDSNLIDNLQEGIVVQNSTGSDITSSVIKGNGKAGVALEGVNGIQIINNQFQNTLNIDEGTGSRDVVISPPLKTDTQTSSQKPGGNSWNMSDIQSSTETQNNSSSGSTTINGYNPGSEAVNLSPLILPTPGELATTPTPVVTVSPNITPVLTPKTIMTGIHATIIGDSIPNDMQMGITYPVELTISNDGSDDWISQHQIGIMALDDTAKYGPEWLGLTTTVPVKSGQSQTVSFNLRAPSKPGTYTLKYQAAREGTGVQVLFGRAYTKTVSVI